MEGMKTEIKLQMGYILKDLGRNEEAKASLSQALEIFTSLDQIENMKECEILVGKIGK